VEDALIRLALYRVFLEDFTGSEFYLRRLIDRFSESPRVGEARLWLGRSHLARGEVNTALVELQAGLAAQETSRSADDLLLGNYLFWIGEACLSAGESSEARDQFERLFEGFPGHPLGILSLERLRKAYQDLGMRGEVERVERLLAGIGEEKNEMETAGRSREGQFAVQVASFSSLKSAQNLVEILYASGWSSEVREVDLGTGRHYRVLIAGLGDREEAGRVARQIREEGFDCTIVEE
jgi:tetratricopeptide (TPR) repeat protein